MYSLPFPFILNKLKIPWKTTVFIICRPLVRICFHNSEQESGQCKEMPLVIYLAFLAKEANLYYTILTAFRKYWPDIVAKFMSGTQETFI